MLQQEIPRPLDPDTLSKLQGLELRARTIVEGYLSGVHHSPHHGFSVEFTEHREYVPGDDLRYVDWKVFGKTDKIYLKQFEAETNLSCYLLVDASASMGYRGPAAALSKFEYAQCLAAALAFLILQQRDRVGMAMFGRQVHHFMAAAGTGAHLNHLLHVVEETVPSGDTATGPVFDALAERIKRRGVVVVISDLLDDVDSLLSGLRHFRHRGHEVIVLHLLDRAELDFPFQQATRFRGLELPADIRAEPRLVKAAYLDQLRGYLRQIEAGCRAQEIDHVLIPTDRSWNLALSRYLASRMSRPK